MNLTPKQLVTMVVAVSVAAVLTPVGVMAASGTLVNIGDPVSGGRMARVSSDGALRVESRTAVSSKAFTFASQALTSLGFVKLAEYPAPERILVTEMSFASGMFATDNGWSFRVNVYAAKRKAGGTGECRINSPANWTPKLLRTVEVPINQTVTLNFAGSPLVVPPAAAGQVSCFGVEVSRAITNASLYVGGTGYRYTP